MGNRDRRTAAASAALASLLCGTAEGAPEVTATLCGFQVLEAGPAHDCGGFEFDAALHPKGLNNHGHWVGHRFRCGDEGSQTIAIRWTPEGGVQSLLDPPGTSVSTAIAVNDSGMVAGTRSTSGSQSHGNWACVWDTDGGLIEIPPLGGSPAESSAKGTQQQWNGGRMAEDRHWQERFSMDSRCCRGSRAHSVWLLSG